MYEVNLKRLLVPSEFLRKLFDPNLQGLGLYSSLVLTSNIVYVQRTIVTEFSSSELKLLKMTPISFSFAF